MLAINLNSKLTENERMIWIKEPMSLWIDIFSLKTLLYTTLTFFVCFGLVFNF